MYHVIEKVEELGRVSGERLKEYVDSNPPNSFSGGKTKNKEYMKLVEDMEQTIDEAEKRVGMSSSCQKGCYSCCNQSIMVSQFEVEFILNYLERNYDFETMKKIKQRIITTANILDAEFGPAPKNAQDTKYILDNEQVMKENYFDLNLPCPLLSDEHTCLVYPVRPAACWGYRVYGNPNDCRDSHDIRHSMVFTGHETYLRIKKQYSIQSGSLPKRLSYHLAGFLPQKVRDSLN